MCCSTHALLLCVNYVCDVCAVGKSVRVFNSLWTNAAVWTGERASLMMTIESPGCAPPRFWLPEFTQAYSNVLSSGRTMYPWAEPEDYDREVSVVASQLATVPAAVEP